MRSVHLTSPIPASPGGLPCRMSFTRSNCHSRKSLPKTNGHPGSTHHIPTVPNAPPLHVANSHNASGFGGEIILPTTVRLFASSLPILSSLSHYSSFLTTFFAFATVVTLSTLATASCHLSTALNYSVPYFVICHLHFCICTSRLCAQPSFCIHLHLQPLLVGNLENVELKEIMITNKEGHSQEMD